MSSRDQLPSDEKPPLFSRWWMWYVLVVAWLVVLIGLFRWFTLSFS
ncbi:MAG: hypothetical protein IMW88_07915 [Thermoflavifilum sp.]|jgi:hypothetical protein|nr:hypothetical protein [Thermoflavifilum sp.]QOR75290.1 MAG: hypothetical protein IMW88_07915 [Thermoflavifilum sp.]